jgi:putative zinc finger protein
MRAGSCARARSVIPFYLEHEAAPAEALATATHLAACASCATDAERSRRTIVALRSLPSPAPPRDIARDVIAALRKLKRYSVDRRAFKWSAIGLVAALIAFDWTRPQPRSAAGLRLLERLGELVSLDAITDGLSNLLSRLLPSPSSFTDVVLGAGAALRGGSAESLGPQAAAVIFIAAAFLLAVLSAALIGGGLALSRSALALRRRIQRIF